MSLSALSDTITTKKQSSLFKNVKWGTFSNQLKNYNSKHKTSKKKNLKSFANYVVKHPSKFYKHTIKRAKFYNNVIKPSKSKKNKSQQ